jgi:cytochrome c oxidase subunit 2
MDRAESAALVIAGVLMTLFFGALIYSATGLGINVPTCVTDVAPFTKGQVIDKGNGRYEVHMVAKMWAFDPKEVRLPPGADVDIYLSALDVTHGLYIENTNVNLMAVPGSVNAARVRFDEEGEYATICHEYCGVAHHNMAGKFIITKDAVVAAVEAPEPAAAEGVSGLTLYGEKGCVACHSLDGTEMVGPTMKGLFGTQRRLADGSTRTADEAYLKESLLQPNAAVAEGYQPIMPAAPLTDEEVEALVDYLKSLS